VKPHLLSIKTTETIPDVDKAIIMFKDTMRSILSSSSNREQRQVSEAHQGRYKGGYQGRYQPNRGGHQGGYQHGGRS
jgi:hypothetical protein